MDFNQNNCDVTDNINFNENVITKNNDLLNYNNENLNINNKFKFLKSFDVKIIKNSILQTIDEVSIYFR